MGRFWDGLGQGNGWRTSHERGRTMTADRAAVDKLDLILREVQALHARLDHLYRWWGGFGECGTFGRKGGLR